VALWPEVQTFVDQIPDPYDQRYVTLKTMGGAATGAAMNLDISTSTTLANELLEIGTSTGNRRAAALGHLVNVAASFVVGDTDEAVLAAERAVAVGADPVYAAAADTWAISVAASMGDIETADNRIDEVDNSAEQTPDYFRRLIDISRAQVEVLQGDLSRGDKRLQRLRSELDARGDRWGVAFIDVFYAAMPARIASGEAEASTTEALRNPGFARRHGVRAAHKGRDRLGRLIETTEFPAFGPLLEFELAKLEHSSGRTSDAEAHAERVRELLAGYPESTLYRQATELISGQPPNG
jgi:hypothetical protein